MIRVWTILLTLILLQACSVKPPIIKTEYVEVPSPPELIPVPADLTITEPPAVIPADITWRQLIQLLMQDRASLEVVNGRLEAIKELSSGER